MSNIIFNEREISDILQRVAKEVHPWYQDIMPNVSVYEKDKYIDLDFNKVRLQVNYDNFGYIEDHDGKLIAKGWKFRVCNEKEVPTIEDGVIFLVTNYFN